MKTMRTAVFAIGAALALSGCVSGRTSTFPPEQSSIFVSGEGVFYTALIEHYDPSDTGYSQEELQAMAAAEVAEYNEEYSSAENPEPVVIEGCTVDQGTASVIYRYATAMDLCRFTEAGQDTGNHPEGLGITGDFADVTGEEMEETWIDARKKETVPLEKVMKKKNLLIVVIKGAVTVQTEKRILYYNGDVQMKDEYTAQVEGGTAYLVFR